MLLCRGGGAQPPPLLLPLLLLQLLLQLQRRARAGALSQRDAAVCLRLGLTVLYATAVRCATAAAARRQVGLVHGVCKNRLL